MYTEARGDSDWTYFFATSYRCNKKEMLLYFSRHRTSDMAVCVVPANEAAKDGVQIVYTHNARNKGSC